MQVAMHFIKFLCSVKPTKMGLFDVLNVRSSMVAA